MTISELSPSTKVAIIGLGYVGLPLAAALSYKFDCVGFDINEGRIRELESGLDRTDELDKARLEACPLRYTTESNEIKDFDIYIVTVPTPVDEDNEPDLGPIESSCRLIGPLLKKGAIVVFESTVYPGVTEDVCGPALEKISGLKCGGDFYLGYSPERINPGDREHTVDKITKVISGQNEEVVDTLEALYGAITSGGVFRARNIMAAEAAKVIENAQRDINIAFVNEITMIFQRMGLSAYDVLEAAGTKWNFLPFSPGLVGGHCIGVDPFYLAYRAKQLGHHPEIILAGRNTNDNMGKFIAACIAERLEEKARVLILGLTFKENVPDLRNSKVIDVIKGLEKRGFEVDVHDPLADPDEAKTHYGVDLLTELGDDQKYACIVGTVPHQLYAEFVSADFSRLLEQNGLVADIKGMWRDARLPDGLRRWEL